MKNNKGIYSALSIATLSLLQQACGSSGGDEDSVVLTPNTSAPELVASWVSDCDGSASSSSTTTSVGTSGGNSGTVRGNFSITQFTFNQDGSGTAATESYDESTCTNTNLLVSINNANFSYEVGDNTLDNNGMTAIEVNINYNGSINYTMSRVINNDLFLADQDNSTAGNDGSSASKRLNGFANEGYERQ